MLRAHQVRDVGGVVRQPVHGGVHRVDEAAPGVHADDAAPLRDGADLVVLQVALGVAEAPGVGVGGDEGLLRVGYDVPERLFTGVGDVHEHPEALHEAQRLGAKVRQAVAGPLVGRAGGKGVVRAPGEHGVAEAQVIERVEPVRLRAEAVQPLEAQQHGGPSAVHDPGEVSGGIADGKPVLHGVELREGGAQDLQHGALRVAEVRVQINGVEQAADAALVVERQMAVADHIVFTCKDPVADVGHGVGMAVKNLHCEAPF